MKKLAGRGTDQNGVSHLTAETNFGPANLTEHRTVVIQDLDFGELAKTHLPEAITE